MGKVVSGVVTDITVYLTLHHCLLPLWHFGRLPGNTTADYLLYLTHCIKAAWNRQKVVTIIFLDIANVFLNAVMAHLLKNIVKLGYPTKIVGFFSAMLKDRYTTLSFNDYSSNPIPIDNGIGQGETAYMILYLIYSHRLSEWVSQRWWHLCWWYLLCGNSRHVWRMWCNTNKMLDKQDQWSAVHNSKAELTKFQCLSPTHCKDLCRNNFIHERAQKSIACVPLMHMLGVHIDQELKLHPHVQQAVQKSEMLLLAINHLTCPSFGLPVCYVQQLYI